MIKKLLIGIAAVTMLALGAPSKADACFPFCWDSYRGSSHSQSTSYDYGNETATATQDDDVYGYRYNGGPFNFNGGEAYAEGDVLATITGHNPYAAADAEVKIRNFGFDWQISGQEGHSVSVTVADSYVSGTVDADIYGTTTTYRTEHWTRYCFGFPLYSWTIGPYPIGSYNFTTPASGVVLGELKGFARQFNGAGAIDGATFAYGWNDTEAGYANEMFVITPYGASMYGLGLAGGKTDVYIGKASGPNWDKSWAKGETKGGSLAFTYGGYNPFTYAKGQGFIGLNARAVTARNNGIAVANASGTASFSYNNIGGGFVAGGGYAKGWTTAFTQVGPNGFKASSKSHMEAGANSGCRDNQFVD